MNKTEIRKRAVDIENVAVAKILGIAIIGLTLIISVINP